MKPAPKAMFLALAMLAQAGCVTGPIASSSGSSCCAKPETAAVFTDKSIYQAESTWTTDQRKQIKLGALAGRPQVIVMFFTHCQFACPIIIQDMKRIEAALPAEASHKVGFTLVSFDSARDTPPVLAEYRRAHALPRGTWTLMRGRPDDVLELAALLGIKFKDDATGQFAHSNVITVLNAKGEVVHQQTGLNQDSGETVQLLQQLVTIAPK